MINALNSGARVLHGRLRGRQLADVAQLRRRPGEPRRRGRRTIELRDAREGPTRSTTRSPMLIVRPRGWHLVERHALVDGEPMSGVALRLRPLPLPQRPRELLAQRQRPVPLPAEARGPPRGAPVERGLRLQRSRSSTSRRVDQGDRCSSRRSSPRSRWTRSSTSCATHAAGLNAGRWDYIFSIIKRFRERDDFVLPDRAQVTMTVPFMRAYTRAAGQDVPPPRRPRDGRDGRLRSPAGAIPR